MIRLAIVALLSVACASTPAALDSAELAAEQEMLTNDATDLEEDSQSLTNAIVENEQQNTDFQSQEEAAQFDNDDQQLQADQQGQQLQNQQQQAFQNDQEQAFQNDQEQPFQDDQEQPFQNDQEQIRQQFQSANQQLLEDSDTQLLNNTDPSSNKETMPEQEFTEVGMGSDDTGINEGVAAAAAEGIPPPNRFSGAPPIPGTMRNLASGEAPAEYRIEAGDTLYDICEQLLGEAGYWPKLWAMNDEIKNPHFVYPDFVLQFFPGDANQPPSIRVVGIEELTPDGKLGSEALVAQETAKLLKDDDYESGLELLNPEDIVVPPEVKELFRDYESLSTVDEMLVQLPAVVLDDKPDILGKIIGSLDGAPSIQDRFHGYVDSDELENGRVYTVMRFKGRVWNGVQLYGYRYDFIAAIRVINMTDGVGMPRVEVFNSEMLVMEGDIVVEYRSRSRKVQLTRIEGSATEGRIVNFTYEGQSVAAIGDFVFLATDTDSNLIKHQALKIYKNNSIRADFSAAAINDETHQIGSMQIIDINDQGAVGYITGSNQEILLGDVVGS